MLNRTFALLLMFFILILFVAPAFAAHSWYRPKKTGISCSSQEVNAQTADVFKKTSAQSDLKKEDVVQGIKENSTGEQEEAVVVEEKAIDLLDVPDEDIVQPVAVSTDNDSQDNAVKEAASEPVEQVSDEVRSEDSESGQIERQKQGEIIKDSDIVAEKKRIISYKDLNGDGVIDPKERHEQWKQMQAQKSGHNLLMNPK